MSDLNTVLTSQEKPKRDLGKLKRIFMALGSVLLVIAAGGAIAFLVIKQNPGLIGVSPNDEGVTQNPQEELNEILEKVGRLILLPNELPTLATVTDLSELRGQEFFENATIDDKVLIYTEAQKAILYRPSEDRIIEVGTVTVEDVSDQEVADPATNPTPTPFGQPASSPTPIPSTPTPTDLPIPTPTETVTPTPTP